MTPVPVPTIANVWTKGTTYPPGSVVRPTSPSGTSTSPPNNAGFETGDFTGWTTSGGAWSVSGSAAYEGTYSAAVSAGAGANQTLVNTNAAGSLTPGTTIRATARINFGANALGSGVQAHLTLTVTPSVGLAQVYTGPVVAADGSSGWVLIDINTTLKRGALNIKVGCSIDSVGTDPVLIDAFDWNYAVNTNAAPQLFYAVQAGTGKSGQIEPVWAATPPNITDGTVTWSSQAPTSITWQAFALLKSGSVEPTWPTASGQLIKENVLFGGNIEWQSLTPQITDTNCPNGKYAVIGASKVFNADNDIVRYCATTNPPDWTSELNAGFLPTGLRNYGSNPTKAMGLYREDLCVFNAEGMQRWQIDEDPLNMTILDALPIGCTHHRSLAPVNNDLFFLSALGVRTVGITAGSQNLVAGDVGMPIDPLVQKALTWATANNVEPIACYYPGTGQYWLAFPGWVADAGDFVNVGASTKTRVFVYTMNRTGEVGAWSNYLLPYLVQDFAMFNDVLEIRATQSNGDEVIIAVDPTASQDTYSTGSPTSFNSVVQWPWLDDGSPGQNKELLEYDIIGTFAGNSAPYTYTLEMGYSEADKTAFTSPYSMTDIDTVPGMRYPFPLVAPSLSVRLTLPSTGIWELLAVNLYMGDLNG